MEEAAPFIRIDGTTPPLVVDGGPFTFDEVEQAARGGRRVEIGNDARRRLRESHEALLAVLGKGQAIYGVNTGFGSLARQRISDDELTKVQRNLLRSHAAGVGPPLPADVVRAMLLLLIGSLCRGWSGVRVEVAEALAALLNAGVTPVVPSIGSVGASGDLAPLAHACLALIGEGEAWLDGERLSGGDALGKAGLEPITLGPKEGLALINGTHLMAAQGALLVSDIERVVSAGVCAAAASIDACRATDAFLDARVYQARNQPTAARVAEVMRGLLADSQIIPSHRIDDPRVQDPYSIRCAAYVLAAAIDTFEHVRAIFEHELGAATDNPLVVSGDPPTVISAGNFHGLPIALPLDHLAPALAHIAGIAERRVYFMLSASDPEMGLAPHLSPKPGLHSGLMITQYTAAACCNELIRLSAPASVANLPTSAGMEDYNSFGPAAAAKARWALELTTDVIAIELLCAAEALDRHAPLKSGTGVERAHELVRTVAPQLVADRSPAPDITAIAGLIRKGRFADVAAV